MVWPGVQQLHVLHLSETRPITIPVGVLTTDSDMSEHRTQTNQKALYQLDVVSLLLMCIAHRSIQRFRMHVSGRAQYHLKCLHNSTLSNTGTIEVTGKRAAKKHCRWSQGRRGFIARVPVWFYQGSKAFVQSFGEGGRFHRCVHRG